MSQTRNLDIFPSGMPENILDIGRDACDVLLKEAYGVYSTSIIQSGIKLTKAPISHKQEPGNFIAHGLETLTLLNCMAVEMHVDDHIEHPWFLLLCVDVASGHALHYGKRKISLNKGDVIVMNARYSHGLSLNGLMEMDYPVGSVSKTDIKNSLKVIGWDYSKKPSKEKVLSDISLVQNLLGHSFMTEHPYTKTFFPLR